MFKNKRQKIFCIGFNKTGTTSIEKVLKDFNYNLGNQPAAELLFPDWLDRNFKLIKRYCKSAEAFQDIPFSLPYTYILLDQYFPNAKFILTVRDSSEQWYNSIVKFHSKLWAFGDEAPNAVELRNAPYRYKGFAYDYIKEVYNTDDTDMYNKEKLIKAYENHMSTVIDYFKNKPSKLLIINTSNKNDYFKLCAFLNKKPIHDNFPWENKTNAIK